MPQPDGVSKEKVNFYSGIIEYGCVRILGSYKIHNGLLRAAHPTLDGSLWCAIVISSFVYTVTMLRIL